jgi:predicted PurR-regulated permease PerM
LKLNTKEKSALSVMTLVASLVIVVFFLQFFAAIVTAIIFAVIFVPVFNWILKKTKKKGLSTLLTLLISIFSIIVPLTAVVWISIDQVETMIKDVSQLIDSDDDTFSREEVFVGVNNFLGRISDGRLEVSLDQLESTVLNVTKRVAEAGLNFLTNTISSIPALVTNIIIFFYVFIALLGNYKKLLDFLRKLNPLGDNISTLYLERAQAMTNSMVKGQFVVGIVQGVIGAVSLHFAGIGYFTFFALFLSVLSLVPLGGGIITIPVGILMLLFGNIPGGLLVLLTHFVVVTNIDNYIRPKLVPKSLSLHPALVMISVFSGIVLFGFLGIVVGPVIFILAVTTLQVYTKVARPSKSL